MITASLFACSAASRTNQSGRIYNYLQHGNHGVMVDNHTLVLRWLSTINPWLPCSNYNFYHLCLPGKGRLMAWRNHRAKCADDSGSLKAITSRNLEVITLHVVIQHAHPTPIYITAIYHCKKCNPSLISNSCI